MESKKQNKLSWRKLDNSAKIFPLSAGKKYSTVFRLSVVLKDEVNPQILESAVIQALEKYKSFKVRMKSGFFWDYLEQNTKKIVIEEERDYPCKYIDPKSNKGYLFKVTYYKSKINIDIFHVLTDGNSGVTFFREIVYRYLELSNSEILDEKERTIRKIENEHTTEDSYMKNYNKKLKSNASGKKAFLLKGKKIKLGAISAIHEIIDLEDLKNECKKYNVTITQYLTAILIHVIYEEQYKEQKSRKPIKVCIPVNLKKYFSSNTISNFFSYMTLETYDEINTINTFNNCLKFVKEEFNKRLNEEEILKTMSANVKIGNNFLVKIIPLFLKRILVRLSYIEIRKYTTITYSNIGRIGIIGKYKDFINYFLMLIAPEQVEKIKCSSCTFEDKVVFTFTSILSNNKIEKAFYDFLRKRKIKVEIESNGVLDDISAKTE